MVIRIFAASIAFTMSVTQAYAYLSPGEAFGIPAQGSDSSDAGTATDDSIPPIPSLTPETPQVPALVPSGSNNSPLGNNPPATNPSVGDTSLPSLIPTPPPGGQTSVKAGATQARSPRIPVRTNYGRVDTSYEPPATIPRNTTNARIPYRGSGYARDNVQPSSGAGAVDAQPADDSYEFGGTASDYEYDPVYGDAYYEPRGVAPAESLPPVGMPSIITILAFIVAALAAARFNIITPFNHGRHEL